MVSNNAEPYVKEVKNCRLAIRHFRHVKKRAKAKKALTRLRTIANKLIRELQRKLHTHSLFETYQKDFLFYQQVLAQQPKDKNKIYSLHEPDVSIIAQGKDHKQSNGMRPRLYWYKGSARCTNITLPKKALKRDNRYQRDKKTQTV